MADFEQGSSPPSNTGDQEEEILDEEALLGDQDLDHPEKDFPDSMVPVEEEPQPDFPALPPPRSLASPVKKGRYPPPEDTMLMLQELFSKGIMDRGQLEQRKREFSNTWQTPLPDHPLCFAPDLDQAVHIFIQMMKSRIGRSASLKVDEGTDKLLRDAQEQMLQALAPILMLDHHYNSGTLTLDSAHDLAIRSAEFLIRGFLLQSYQRRILVLGALNLRNKETEGTCFNVWDLDPSPQRGPSSSRNPELFGQVLQQDIFAKAKSAMDVCSSMAPIVCPPQPRRTFPPKVPHFRPRGPPLRRQRMTTQPRQALPSTSRASPLLPPPAKISKSARYVAPFDMFRKSLTVALPQAGLLRHFASNWFRLTNDSLVRLIVTGYKINFHAPVYQEQEPKEISFGSQETQILTEEVNRLLSIGAIVPVPSNSNDDGGFVSRLFVVPKKDRGFRPIIDLSLFNNFVAYEHFKMEGLFLLKDLLIQNDFMAKVDLKDAYLSVPMYKGHHKFLRFRWLGILYQFVCLCFGLSCAPRVFTKVLKPIVAYFRQMGVRLIIYLDDILFMHQDPKELTRIVKFFCDFVQALGFLVNQKKSEFSPSKQISFLGFKVCSETLTLTLPDNKVQDLTVHCTVLKAASQVTARKLAATHGKFAASSAAILPVRLFSRHSQLFLIDIISKVGWDTPVVLPASVKGEIDLWLLGLNSFNGRPLRLSTPQVSITCDASLSGWGAHCEDARTHGVWSSEERQYHINFLELKAAFLSLQCFVRDMSGIHVRISLDNATAIAYINKQGGTKSVRLCELAIEIWTWCLDRAIMLSADYIPGSLNTVADAESRAAPDSSDWCLDHSIFTRITSAVGHPEIDLFASRHNAQTHRFFSRLPDPLAEKVDAFNQIWSSSFLYAFPPFNLIGKCLQKTVTDKAHLLLITPLWPGQGWYPLLLALCCGSPLLLPKTADLMVSPIGTSHPLLQQARFFLVAWQITGSLDRILIYRRTLQRFSDQPSQIQLEINTLQPSSSGIAGVTDNKLIPFVQL